MRKTFSNRWLRGQPFSPARTARGSQGAEEAVAAVAEAGQDVALVVEFFVEHGDVDLRVGMGGLEGGQALGRGDDGNDRELADAAFLEAVDGVGEGAAGGEHGVEQEDPHGFGAGRELAVVLHGPESLLVAVDAHVADLGGGDQIEDAVDHAEAGAEDGNEEHLLGELLGVARGEGGLDADVFQLQVAGDFVDEEIGQLVEGLAEMLVVGIAVAEDGELVLDEGVAKDGGVGVHRGEL